MASGFETPSVIMRPLVLMAVQAPAEDIERIMAAVTAITPLAMGAYDGNAFVTGPGTERYRPLEGGSGYPLPSRRGRGQFRSAGRSGSYRKSRRGRVPGAQLPGASDPSSIHSHQPIERPQ